MKASEAAIKQVYHLAAPFNRLHSILFYLRTKNCSPLPLSPSPSLQAPLFLDACIRRSCPDTFLLFKTILIVISPVLVTDTSKLSFYKTILIIIIRKRMDYITQGPSSRALGRAPSLTQTTPRGTE